MPGPPVAAALSSKVLQPFQLVLRLLLFSLLLRLLLQSAAAAAAPKQQQQPAARRAEAASLLRWGAPAVSIHLRPGGAPPPLPQLGGPCCSSSSLEKQLRGPCCSRSNLAKLLGGPQAAGAPQGLSKTGIG